MKPLPESFEPAMRAILLEDFDDFAASLQKPAPISLRLHPAKKSRYSAFPPVPWSRFGRYLPDRPAFTQDPLFHAGSYYVQEASSMFLEQALIQHTDLLQPLRVLDLCAAPGGKSTHLLSLLNRDSLLVSNEVIRTRASVLSENIQKWGCPNAIVTNNDPAEFSNLNGFFDVIVVDAPCSGEGLFRKDPQAMEQWSPDHVQLCCNRQKRILADVWPALRTGGILIYSTCTYNRAENEENLKWLGKNHAVEYRKLSIDPAWGVVEVDEENISGYRFFPHRTHGEGFFIAVLQKTGDAEPSRHKTKKSVAHPPKNVIEKLDTWISRPGDSTYFAFNDLLFFTPTAIASAFELLLQHLKVLYAGTNLATLKHEKLVPEHALALSTEINLETFPRADVPEHDAVRYLQKDAIALAEAKRGFTLLTCENLPIGWANVLPNRVNNMYPPEWRIRNKQ